MLELTVLLVSTIIVLLAIYFWGQSNEPKTVEKNEQKTSPKIDSQRI